MYICTIKVLDLQSVDPELRGFNGGFVHNSRVYFVPFYTGVAAGSNLVSVDATTFSAASAQVRMSMFTMYFNDVKQLVILHCSDVVFE